MGRFMRGVALAVLSAALAGPAVAVEWKVSLWGERRALTEHVHRLAALVEQKTDGEFTFDISYGELSNERENLDGISIGAFEMAQFCAGYHVDKNPSLTVLELPFLGVSALEDQAAVSDAVYAHPAVEEDLARWNARLLMASPMPPSNLAGTGAPRDTVEEFQGMRVLATGSLGKAFELAGAVPVPLTSPEAYDALESGVVDAVAMGPHAHLAFRTMDLATWWTENFDIATVNCPVVVNIDAYEALSPEYREALDSSVDEAVAHSITSYRKLLDEWSAILDEKKVQRIRIADGEMAKFREIAAPIRKQWLADMEARGIPGQELYDLVQSTLEERHASD